MISDGLSVRRGGDVMAVFEREILTPVVSHLTGVVCELCEHGYSRGVSGFEVRSGGYVVLCYRCAAKVIAWFHGWRP